MSGKEPDRNMGSRWLAGIVLATILGASTDPARAGDSLWDSALQTLNLKSTPAGPAPAFVEKTRPDPEGMSYLPPAVPHKVSPLAVKTAAEIQAKKDALDAAQVRQTNPNAPVPLQVAKARKTGKAKPPADVPD
ncbi:MAG: hypothetical protein ACRYGP_28985 [Janthinobacterium lividum]